MNLRSQALALSRTPYFGFGVRALGSGVSFDEEFRQRLLRLHRLCERASLKSINSTETSQEEQNRAQQAVLEQVEKLDSSPWKAKELSRTLLSPWQFRSEKEEILRSLVDFAAPLFLWARQHEKVDDVCVLFALRQAHAEQMIPVCRGVAEPSPVTVWLNGEGYTYKSPQELRAGRKPDKNPDDRYVFTA